MRSQWMLNCDRFWLTAQVVIAVQASTIEVRAKDADVARHWHGSHRQPAGEDVTLLPTSQNFSSDRAQVSPSAGSSLQLLRRESVPLTKTSEEQRSGALRGAYDFLRAISAGDISAFCIDNDIIYAVGYENFYNSVLHGGIYKQDFNRMTPSTNWTLIGYGAMKSIAVRNGVMYGVGSITRMLWQQPILGMANENVWLLKSKRKLAAISILDHTIYAASEDDGKLYKQDFPWDDDPDRPWMLVGEGTGRIVSFCMVPGVVQPGVAGVVEPEVYAVFESNRVFHKVLNPAQPQLEWGLKGEADAGFADISVQGDCLYAVGGDHRIYRQPLRTNFHWQQMFVGSWVSVAIQKNTMYGLDMEGRIWSQNLREDSTRIHWQAVTGWGTPSVHPVSQIVIQGETLYGVSGDHLVYKQGMHTLTTSAPSAWLQASKCCAKSIAAYDGLLYGIGSDDKLYVQVDSLMTIHTEWTLISRNPVKSITFRGDTIYGVQASGHIYQQRLSTLTPLSAWVQTEMLEDTSPGPSGRYLMIFAHGDTMYAVGEDKVVYSKLLQSRITWPSGVHEQDHNTRTQAVTHNLTDLLTTRVTTVTSSTGVWEQSTTTSAVSLSLARSATTAGIAWMTGTSAGSTTSSSQVVGLQPRYTDYFNSPTHLKEEQEAGQVLPPPYRPPDNEFPDLYGCGALCSPGAVSWTLPLLLVLSSAFVEPSRSGRFRSLSCRL